MDGQERPPLNGAREPARKVPGKEGSWRQEWQVQRPWGGVCLTSCRNSKEASAARSKERVRQGPEPAGPWGLDNPTEHLESVSSFQMYLKDRHHVNVLCSF